MTDPRENLPRHLIALGAGIVALAAFFLIPPGPVGYLASIAVAAAAVLIGHGAVRRRGPVLLAAILGLVLSYFVLLTSVALLVVRLARLGG